MQNIEDLINYLIGEEFDPQTLRLIPNNGMGLIASLAIKPMNIDVVEIPFKEPSQLKSSELFEEAIALVDSYITSSFAIKSEHLNQPVREYSGESVKAANESLNTALLDVWWYSAPVVAKPSRHYIYGVDRAVSTTKGDETCINNAKSDYLRCAVNPSGPCDGCKYYQSI